MLGDWDLQSTLLRRTIQEGARRVASGRERRRTIAGGQRGRACGLSARIWSRPRERARTDGQAATFFPLVEDFATEHLMETSVRPAWLICGALVLTLAGAVCFTRGWLGAGLVLLVLSTPLDLIAARLGNAPVEAVARQDVEPARALARRGPCAARDRPLGDAPRHGLGRAGCCWRRLRVRRSSSDREGRNAGGEMRRGCSRAATRSSWPFRSRSRGVWTAYLLAMLRLRGCLILHRSAGPARPFQLTRS